MKDCPFCKHLEKARDILYENQNIFSTLCLYPTTPGAALIIPIRHVKSIEDLTQEEFADILPAISNTLDKIWESDLKQMYTNYIENPLDEKSVFYCKKALQSPFINEEFDGYNIGINAGQAAGQTVEHLHIHIFPRYKGDVKDPTGGVRNMIPGMGNYKK